MALKENDVFLQQSPKNETNRFWKPSQRALVKQVTMAILANMTIVSSGMGIGFPAITLTVLTDKSQQIWLTDSEASWFASLASITCPLGGLLSGYFLDKLGRKRTLISINIISIVAWLIMSIASDTNKDLLFIELIVARIIIGVGIGMSSSPASVYSAEICHPSIRGRLTLLTGLATGVGMLAVYLLGYFFPIDWRLVTRISGIFTFVTMLMLAPVPESPAWLISRGRLTDAEHSLRIVNGLRKDDVTNEYIKTQLAELSANYRLSHTAINQDSTWLQLKRPEVYKPLSIMIVFFAFQQLSGIFVVIVYGAKFAIEAGVTIDPFLCTVFIGLTRVVTTIFMSFISDRLGRKPLAKMSGVGMAGAMFGLAICGWTPVNDGTFHWLPTFLIIAFLFSCTLGFLTLPFAMIAEVYPPQARGLASGLTIFAGYTMSFFMLKLYPLLIATMGNVGLFIMFGVVSFFGIFFVHIWLPETKGRTLQDIEDLFKGAKPPVMIPLQNKASE